MAEAAVHAPSYLQRADGTALAYRHSTGKSPGILFCPGFHSDMHGVKALALEQWCREWGRQYTRFDYYGHGESDGVPGEGCIGRWRDDTLAILDEVTSGPQLVVGSSMGGWVMLLAARERSTRVFALVGLAAAPDFTQRLRGSLSDTQRGEVEAQGYTDIANCYDDGEPYRIRRELLEEGDDHLLLESPLALDVPVRLIQGQADDDVPWDVPLKLAACISGTDVEVQLVKGGDHRLSQPADLARLRTTVERLLAGDGS